MPSPSGWSPVISVSVPSNNFIAALLGSHQWAKGTLTFSFPAAGAFWSTDPSIGYGPSTSDEPPWNAADFGPLSTSDKTYFRSALDAWAAVANLQFTEVTETSSNVGDIRAAYGFDAEMEGAEAYAYLPWSAPISGDIWFNSRASIAYEVWTPGTNSYLTVLHEMGHALGLKHPFSGTRTLPDAYDTMSYTLMSYSAVAGNESSYFSFFPTTPMILDIQAIQYLYGVNTTTGAGDSVYTFGDSTTYHQAIWDGGGTDTIVYTGFTSASIDLNAGQGSTIGNAVYAEDRFGNRLQQVDNIWVAHGVSIENATGGRGGDVITGTASANYLNGGSGNDTLTGGAGNDVFDADSTQRTGNDVFYGGTGDDTYYLASTADSAIEYANEGTDTVWVGFSFSISALGFVENLFAMGTGAHSLTGNSAANRFQGAAGNDSINGGLGNDTIQYSGASTGYVIAQNGGAFTITSPTTGTDSLTSIEFARFSDQTVSLLPDATPPTVLTFSPADGATGVATGSNLVVTFSEAIARGAGTIVLKTASGSTVETYNAATSSSLVISGSSLTVNPTAELAYGTGYRLEFAAGTVKDLAANSYAGSTSYDFTTATGLQLVGTAAADVLTGGVGADTISGAGEDDVLTGLAGDDSLDGGAGIDAAAYLGPRAQYSLVLGASDQVIDPAPGDGTDTLTGIERLLFADVNVALDLDGNAGMVAKILGAVFGLPALGNLAFVGTGLSRADSGTAYEQLVQLSLDYALGAGASSSGVVQLLHTNIFGVAADAATLAEYTALIDRGSFTQAGFGVYAADTFYNTEHIDLAGLAVSGLQYL